MISSKDLLSLNYYNYKQPFTGSCMGMRYRVEKHASEPLLVATIWPEPFSYEKTPRKSMTTAEFPFSNEGKEQTAAWLDKMCAEGSWPQTLSYSFMKKAPAVKE